MWKAPLADPVRGGRPAAAASANAYTLNLWAADEDRTLTERQRRQGEWVRHEDGRSREGDAEGGEKWSCCLSGVAPTHTHALKT